jgi:hypothetical protein
MRVDRDDAPAMALHMRGHGVRRLERGRAGAYHGDGVVAGQDPLDHGVLVGHLATVTRRGYLVDASTDTGDADGCDGAR